ncbi:hypothetical protein OGAPHI_005965 [Ogataea philodendri]|uniref:Uncharacterized protein n=1 Tax=Ogataea philodendri TaxID=1378263 RepID=A0A9P8NYA0_9ASCO|nr:uncharacterized protein OGAPHI_005965 [Ogataea philodendri]KAH3661787.1 hypothetical protein OGAPHI_005965 [Ogataea philodendri]
MPTSANLSKIVFPATSDLLIPETRTTCCGSPTEEAANATLNPTPPTEYSVFPGHESFRSTFCRVLVESKATDPTTSALAVLGVVLEGETTCCTPFVSRYSIVLGTSKIDLGPEQITPTGVLDSSSKSALTSIKSKGRETPPNPPVANRSIPAAWARIMVEAIVVPPVSFLAITNGMSRRETLYLSPGTDIDSRSATESPTFGTPSTNPTVAGTAPFSRISCSTDWAISMLAGYGRPWVMIVLSKATTGPFCLTQSAISDVT